MSVFKALLATALVAVMSTQAIAAQDTLGDYLKERASNSADAVMANNTWVKERAIKSANTVIANNKWAKDTIKERASNSADAVIASNHKLKDRLAYVVMSQPAKN